MKILPPGAALILDISTAHLLKEDTVALNNLADVSNPEFRVVSHAHGWIVYVSGTDDEDHILLEEKFHRARLSNSFEMLYRYALAFDAILINFDQDADTLEFFPTYEWEVTSGPKLTDHQRGLLQRIVATNGGGLYAHRMTGPEAVECLELEKLGYIKRKPGISMDEFVFIHTEKGRDLCRST